MKKNLLFVTLLALTTVGGYSQTNVPTTLPGFGKEIYDTIFGPGMTNLEVFGGVTRNINNNKWGEFVGLIRNIPLGSGPFSIGIGPAIDHYDNKFYSLSGQVSVKADITPFAGLGTNTAFTRFFSKQVFAPHVYMGAGMPFGSNADITSSPETVEATGVGYRIPVGSKLMIKVFGDYGSRQGIGSSSGAFLALGGALSYKFW